MTIRRKLLDNVSRRFPTLGKLRRDNKGVAAIEFAFVAPIMIAFYFGMTEVAMAIMADRNVSHATAVTADLATQLPILNSVELADIMTATVAVLNIPDNRLDQITIELNSYQKQTDGTVVQVGYARLGPQITTGGPAVYDTSALNAQMFNAQSGVVVARLNYTYEPVTFNFVTQFTCSVGNDRIVNCNVT